MTQHTPALRCDPWCRANVNVNTTKSRLKIELWLLALALVLAHTHSSDCQKRSGQLCPTGFGLPVSLSVVSARLSWGSIHLAAHPDSCRNQLCVTATIKRTPRRDQSMDEVQRAAQHEGKGCSKEGERPPSHSELKNQLVKQTWIGQFLLIIGLVQAAGTYRAWRKPARTC